MLFNDLGAVDISLEVIFLQCDINRNCNAALGEGVCELQTIIDLVDRHASLCLVVDSCCTAVGRLCICQHQSRHKLILLCLLGI